MWQPKKDILSRIGCSEEQIALEINQGNLKMIWKFGQSSGMLVLSLSGRLFVYPWSDFREVPPGIASMLKSSDAMQKLCMKEVQ